MNNLNDIFFAPAANQDLTYDQVLEDVQRYFAENHASTIAEAGEGNAERATTLLKELMVQYIVKRKYAIEGLTTEELCEKLYEDMAGYSFLKKWIGAADCRIAAPCFSSVLPYMFIPLSLGVVCHEGEAVEKQFFFRQPFKDSQLGAGDLGIHFVFVDVPAGVDNVVF